MEEPFGGGLAKPDVDEGDIYEIGDWEPRISKTTDPWVDPTA